MNIGTCAVCANTEVDLIHIDIGNLRDLYNNVCGFQTEFVNGPPSYMCRFCASLIIKYNNFQDQCQASVQASQELFTAIQKNANLTLVIDRSNICILPILSYAQPEKLVYQETDNEDSFTTKVSLPKQKRNPIPSFKIQIPNKTIKIKSSNEDFKAVASIKNEIEKDCTSKIVDKNLSTFLEPDLFHDYEDPDLNKNNEYIEEVNAENSSNKDMENYEKNGFEENITAHILSDKKYLNLEQMDVNEILNKDYNYLPEMIQNEKNVSSMDKYIELVPMSTNDAMAAYEIKLAIKSKENKINSKLVCNICQCEINSSDTMSHFLYHEKKKSRVFCQICKITLSSKTPNKHNDWYHDYKFICKICSEVNFSIPDASQHFVSCHGIEKDKFKALIDEYKIKEIGVRDRTYAKKSCVKTKEHDTYVYFTKILSKLIKIEKSQNKRKKNKAVSKKTKTVSKKTKMACIKIKTAPKKARIATLGLLGSHFTRQRCTPEEQYQAMLDRKKTYKYKIALYKCKLCFRVFLREEKLLKHYKVHSPLSGRYQCDICKTYIRTRKTLIQHLRRQHDYRYQCKECDFNTFLMSVALTHQLKHLNQKIPCDKCGRDFNTKQAMYTHARYAHPATAVCSLCGEAFGTHNGMVIHRKFSHRSQLEKEQIEKLENKDRSSEFYCQKCDVQFLYGDAYDKHLISSGTHSAFNEQFRTKSRKNISAQNRIRNKKIKLYKQGDQPEAIDETIKQNLVKRRRNIKNPASRPCTVCGLELKNVMLARVHYNKYHPNDEYYINNLKKIYKCPLCDFTSVNPVGVYTHKKNVHSTEKPFKCQYCDVAFKSKQNMLRHTLTHTGEKPYECAYCQRRFAQKITVQLHIQTVHLKIPYPPWQNKNKKNREKRQNRSKKTTNKRKRSSEEVEPQSTEWVEQEVVEDSGFYLEAQELATDYIMKDNLVYSTTSRVNRGLQSSYVLSINEP